MKQIFFKYTFNSNKMSEFVSFNKGGSKNKNKKEKEKKDKRLIDN